MSSLAELAFGGLMVYMGLRKLNNALGELRQDVSKRRGLPQVGTGKYDLRPCPGNGKGGMKCHLTEGGSIERRAEIIAERIRKDSLDPRIRRAALKALTEKCDGGYWCTPPKDGRAEIRKLWEDARDPNSQLAKGLRGIEGIFHHVRENVRYTRDHSEKDVFSSAPRTLFDFHAGDCFPVGTLVLRDDFTFVPVEDVREGMRIWGRDKWSTVQRAWYKGILEVDAVRLNNGSTVKLTPDHHVYVAHCDRHTGRLDSQPCSCPIAEREIRRVRVSELQPDMVLINPARLEFGSGKMDVDRAYVEGLFIADGWCSHNYDFSIAGKDGFPKEAQKAEVAAICERLGIPTRGHERYITVKDHDWALRMHQMGAHAWEKHALTMNLEEGAAAALLQGIMADSGGHANSNGRTFTSTSRMLALQVRVLHKMFGVSCGYSYIEDHGGLGSHPIYRLYARYRNQDDQKAEKMLRVREIERGVMSVPCYDLTTDDHYVYLPEHDVTVSNCDDFTITLGALLRSVGFPEKLRVYWLKGESQPGHIALVVNADPKRNAWLVLDATVDKVAVNGRSVAVYPGWEASKGQVDRYRDFPV